MKKFSAIKIVFLIVLLKPGSPVSAQDKIDSAVNILSEKYQQEKIYIAYNKSNYVAGETVRYKAFLFAGYQLSDISSNLYVELLGQNKTVIARQRIPVINGFGEGGIAIPDSTLENVYYIRAYTKWMLNFSESFQYIHPVLIYNPLSQRKLSAKQAVWHAAAFAEGGTLVDSIASHIAVRLFSNGDLPEHWQGYLIDSSLPQQKIVSFQSLDQNIAEFYFTPLAGKKYQVIVEDSKGAVQKCDLPPVENTGVCLSVKQTDTVLQYMVQFQNIRGGEAYKLVGTVDNNIVYKATVRHNSPVFIHSFPTKDMQKGVLRLTLFDNDYHVVAERLCFLHPGIANRVLLDSVQTDHAVRAANTFTVKTDSGGTYYAIVMDEDTRDPYTEDNLLSSFWLTTDVARNIKNARSYFAGTDKSKQALDVLLVTEKWDRFNWQEILNGQYPVIQYGKDNFLSYLATVFYKKKILPNATLNLVIFLPDSSRQLLQAKTNAEGQFLVDGLLFEGNARLSYKAVSKKIFADDLSLELTEVKSDSKYESALPESDYTVAKPAEIITYPAEIERNIENVKNEKGAKESYHELTEVVVQTRRKTPTQLLNEKLSSGRFSNSREVIYDFVNQKQDGATGNDLLAWINARAPGDTRRFSYYIDEYQVEKEMVSLTAISEVAMIKFQGNGAAHQIFIYLKKSEERLATAKVLNHIPFQGYPKTDPLIMPDYSREKDNNTWKTDTRDVLYWSDPLLSDTTGQSFKIKFYNNDSAKKFRVIIMGFHDELSPVWHEASY